MLKPIGLPSSSRVSLGQGRQFNAVINSDVESRSISGNFCAFRLLGRKTRFASPTIDYPTYFSPHEWPNDEIPLQRIPEGFPVGEFFSHMDMRYVRGWPENQLLLVWQNLLSENHNYVRDI